MQISVILAHPDSKSFNHAIARTAVEAIKTSGHKVFFHDLYKEKFDPLLHIEEIVQVDPQFAEVHVFIPPTITCALFVLETAVARS